MSHRCHTSTSFYFRFRHLGWVPPPLGPGKNAARSFTKPCVLLCPFLDLSPLSHQSVRKSAPGTVSDRDTLSGLAPRRRSAKAMILTPFILFLKSKVHIAWVFHHPVTIFNILLLYLAMRSFSFD